MLSGVLALLIGIWRRASTPAGFMAVAAALIPLVPLVGFVVYVIRLIHSLDELERLIHLEALMLQFGATSIMIMGYGMLARAGVAPNVTIVDAYPFLWLALFLFWGAGLLLVRRRYQ